MLWTVRLQRVVRRDPDLWTLRFQPGPRSVDTGQKAASTGHERPEWFETPYCGQAGLEELSGRTPIRGHCDFSLDPGPWTPDKSQRPRVTDTRNHLNPHVVNSQASKSCQASRHVPLCGRPAKASDPVSRPPAWLETPCRGQSGFKSCQAGPRSVDTAFQAEPRSVDTAISVETPDRGHPLFFAPLFTDRR